jgi:5-methylcytosine-specific restriction endonuclease McrA
MSLQPYTKEWLEELCLNSYSFAEVLRKAGRKQSGGNQTTLKKKINEFKIDISHFTGQRWQQSPNQDNQDYSNREKYQIEDIFIMNSPVSQKVMRGYVERHNLLEYKCQNCGCDGHWQNGIISLEIDHIDGDNTNNQLSNLRYLCPNCHALTETYRGKNKALKNRNQN